MPESAINTQNRDISDPLKTYLSFIAYGLEHINIPTEFGALLLHYLTLLSSLLNPLTERNLIDQFLSDLFRTQSYVLECMVCDSVLFTYKRKADKLNTVFNWEYFFVFRFFFLSLSLSLSLVTPVILLIVVLPTAEVTWQKVVSCSVLCWTFVYSSQLTSPSLDHVFIILALLPSSKKWPANLKLLKDAKIFIVHTIDMGLINGVKYNNGNTGTI